MSRDLIPANLSSLNCVVQGLGVEWSLVVLRSRTELTPVLVSFSKRLRGPDRLIRDSEDDIKNETVLFEKIVSSTSEEIQ